MKALLFVLPLVAAYWRGDEWVDPDLQHTVWVVVTATENCVPRESIPSSVWENLAPASTMVASGKSTLVPDNVISSTEPLAPVAPWESTRVPENIESTVSLEPQSIEPTVSKTVTPSPTTEPLILETPSRESTLSSDNLASSSTALSESSAPSVDASGDLADQASCSSTPVSYDTTTAQNTAPMTMTPAVTDESSASSITYCDELEDDSGYASITLYQNSTAPLPTSINPVETAPIGLFGNLTAISSKAETLPSETLSSDSLHSESLPSSEATMHVHKTSSVNVTISIQPAPEETGSIAPSSSTQSPTVTPRPEIDLQNPILSETTAFSDEQSSNSFSEESTTTVTVTITDYVTVQRTRSTTDTETGYDSTTTTTVESDSVTTVDVTGDAVKVTKTVTSDVTTTPSVDDTKHIDN